MEREAIALLLEEYKVLRAEFAQRVTVRVHLLGFVGVLAAVLVAAGGFRRDSATVYVAVGVGVLGLWAWRTTNGAAQRLGAHLQDVEQRLNELAARAYGARAAVFRWEGMRQRRRAQAPRLLRLVRSMMG